MRLPWIQVAMEVLEVSAPELGARLDVSDAEAFYALVRMMAWARARCSEDKPPSAAPPITGPTAARQIAAAAQFKGDPDAFVEACCTLAFPVLERVTAGVRVKGLDRYDAAWVKNNPAKAAAWKLSTGNRPETEREPSENRPEPGRQMQTQMQTQNTSTAAAAPVVPLPQKPTDPHASPEAFFAHIQHQRHSHGLVTEKLPRNLSTWWSEVGMELNGDFERLDAAYEHFSDDPYWRDKKPEWPFQAFMSKWRDHVPRAARTA